MKRLKSEYIRRPSTKWEFVSFFNADVKVVLDHQQPLLGTGPLPDLHNLGHQAYQDNLCLWCIAVHQGALFHQSTKVASGLVKSFYKLQTMPTNCPKKSLGDLDKVERHLNRGATLSDWLSI